MPTQSWQQELARVAPKMIALDAAPVGKIGNQSGIDFLLMNGFVVTNKKGTRMIKGIDIEWNPQNIFSRIGGNYG